MVRHSRVYVRIALLLTLLLVALGVVPAMALGLTSQESLGKQIYFDRTLSQPNGQACSDCHLPSAGWADPDRGLPVSEGVVLGLYGGRNSPTSAYAAYSPAFQWNAMKGVYLGGQFWDGRAADLAAQAKGPVPQSGGDAQPGQGRRGRLTCATALTPRSFARSSGAAP